LEKQIKGMVLGFIRFLFSWRRQIWMLRRRWDRIRERADKTANREKRLNALRILDQVEPTLVLLEEQKISRFDRPRLIGQVKMGIMQARNILEEKGEKKVIQQPASQAPPPEATRRPIRF